jgi:hypothetical protein
VSLDVLFVAESLVPARGGAERFALELLSELARRGHRARARWLQGGVDSGAAVHALPDGVEGEALPAVSREGVAYWRSTRARCAVLGEAVASAPRADVVVTQLHGAPAAFAAGAPVVLLLPSYESLCKLAVGVGATVRADAFEPVCPPPRDCEGCPAARALAEPERVALRAQRAAQDGALARAHSIVACSQAVAAAAREWAGRGAVVIPPVAGALAGSGRHAGHLLVAAGAWGPHKGSDVVEPIVRGLTGHSVVVTQAGLDEAMQARLRALGASLRDEPLGRVLDGAHACIVPSRWPEPFCRIAFEAQSCGVPVVAPRNGGLPEHVVPGGLVDPASGAEGYLAALRTLDDEPAWSTASAQARDRAAAVVASRPLERAVEAIEAAGRM